MKNKKVAFVCAIHQSEAHRPNGFELFNDYLESIYTSCKYPFKLFVFDNESDDKFEVENFNKEYDIPEDEDEQYSYDQYMKDKAGEKAGDKAFDDTSGRTMEKKIEKANKQAEKATDT